MKQLTEDQAIKFAESGQWKDFTYEEIVKLQLYQELLCVPFSIFHKAVEEVLGRPVFTHEFAEFKHLIEEYEGLRPAPTFDEIMKLLPKDLDILFFDTGEQNE